MEKLYFSSLAFHLYPFFNTFSHFFHIFNHFYFKKSWHTVCNIVSVNKMWFIHEFAGGYYMNTLSFFNPRFTSDLFDVIDRNFGTFADETGGSFMPRADVTENKDAYVIDMELPGFTENDITIDLKDRVLSIASVKKTKEEKKAEDTVCLLQERRPMNFSRSFTLPDDIDSENVTASLKNGVLSISIPRKAASQARRIALQTA